jgi:uncharacterized protein YndB with AHSA1/START domain
MDEYPGASVTITQRFGEPAERVFDAWLDPGVTRRWLFVTPSGLIVECRIEPRVGGHFTIVDRRDGEDVAHTGEYVEIDRPRRLVFTFAVPKYSSAISRVTIAISPVAGGCLLTLTNDGVPPEFADGARKGWTDLMSRLETVLAG